MMRLNMPQGEQDVTGTSSIEMPQALKSLFEMQSPMQPGAAQAQQQPGGMNSRLGIGPEQLGATGAMGADLPSYQQGGMIGPDGYPAGFSEFLSGPRPSGRFTSAVYDQAMQGVGNPYGYAAQNNLQPQTMPFTSGKPNLDQSRNPFSVSALNQMANSGKLASYQEGGMIGPDGMPVPEGMPSEMPMGMPPMAEPQGVGLATQAGQQGPMDPQMMEMHLNQFANQNPQQMQQIRDAIMQELQSGELTPQELNQVVQLATVAAQNPEMYSYVRNYAIQQGIATDADVPQEYDQGLVFSLMLVGRALQQQMQSGEMEVAGAPTGGMPTTQAGVAPEGMMPMGGQPVIPSMAMGGPVPGSMGQSKPVVIEAHTGEYVIPKNVVEMKGKEFFDSLVEKYRDNK